MRRCFIESALLLMFREQAYACRSSWSASSPSSSSDGRVGIPRSMTSRPTDRADSRLPIRVTCRGATSLRTHVAFKFCKIALCATFLCFLHGERAIFVEPAAARPASLQEPAAEEYKLLRSTILIRLCYVLVLDRSITSAIHHYRKIT